MSQADSSCVIANIPNLDRTPETPTHTHIKQSQTNSMKWQTLGAFVPVLALYFNTFLKNNLMVTIHGRKKN